MHSRNSIILLLERPRIRAALVLGCAACLLAVVVAVFWFQDLRYATPTPKPAGYHPPLVGAALPWPAEIHGATHDSRPVLLHFFNQDCPCSRFNVDQARSLADQFRDKVRFVLVLQLAGKSPAVRQRALAVAQRKFGSVEGVVDLDGKIAGRYGVYSTPQAVILDLEGEIVYRGNYNVSRYCTDPGTQFARIALESVLAGHRPPTLPALAYQAYGCELPKPDLH